jgi:threonyl-tRNA synthetase
LDRNDHRLIAQRQDLFHFQDEAPGAAFWHPRGWTLLRLLESRVRLMMEREGFQEVRTPQVLAEPIWRASGHLEHFASGMFAFERDERRFALKPASCPGHIQIALRAGLSHRDLPLRLGELGLVHRDEPSGAIQGLFRLRQFTQDDGHIFCAARQVAGEVARFCRSLRALYAEFGFEEMRVGFSTRPSSRAGADEDWDRAEQVLQEAARAAGLECALQPGEGAFYGPKLEFSLRDRLGRGWQCGTIQLDLAMPERFDLAYVDSGGASAAGRPCSTARPLGAWSDSWASSSSRREGACPPGWPPSRSPSLPSGTPAAASLARSRRPCAARACAFALTKGASRSLARSATRGRTPSPSSSPSATGRPRSAR